MKIPGNKSLYPLSDAQRMLRWSEIFSIEPVKVEESNILGFFVKIHGDNSITADKAAHALERALNYVLCCNDSLRLRIIRTFRGLRQYISDYKYYPIERIQVDGEDGFRQFVSSVDQYKVGWFDEIMICAKLLMMSSHQCAMVMRIHHAVMDGYSIRLLFEQLNYAYSCYIKGNEPKSPDLKYSITNFFNEVDKYHSSKLHAADRKYWFKVYNSQRKYSFPAGYRSEKGNCDIVKRVIGYDLYQQIIERLHEFNCSMQSYMMTMAAVTVYVLTGKENFCIYSLTHGRHNAISKKTIGCMQNTVPTFYDIDGNKPLSNIIVDSYMELLEALSHGRLAMGEQVPLSYKEPIKHGFNFNHGWLLFSSMEYGGLFENSEELILGLLPQLNLPHQFYVSMLEVPGDHITFEVGYQTRKFSREKAESILGTYAGICRLAAAHPRSTPNHIRTMLINEHRPC